MRRILNNNGYTIVEMMIVVIIIGVLVSIAVPSYTNLVSRAKKSACQANQRTIEIARAYNMILQNSYGLNLSDISEAFEEIGFTGDSTQEDLLCPGGGLYVFALDTFEVDCSINEHND